MRKLRNAFSTWVAVVAIALVGLIGLGIVVTLWINTATDRITRLQDSASEQRVVIAGLEERITTLEENERGDNAAVSSVIACIRNAKGYSNADGAMSHAMMSQCIDDWFKMNGKRLKVDY